MGCLRVVCTHEMVFLTLLSAGHVILTLSHHVIRTLSRHTYDHLEVPLPQITTLHTSCHATHGRSRARHVYKQSTDTETGRDVVLLARVSGEYRGADVVT